MISSRRLLSLLGVFFRLLVTIQRCHADSRKPNVLFISVDDLNDWIGCLGGHPQAKTPHFDRLAASGVLFTNAHCPAPACNPCRTAIMTGMAPNVSGMYENGQKMREVLPDAELLPRYFSRHGYWSSRSDNDGPSLIPLLKEPDADWDHTSVTFLSDAGSYGMSTEDWRYIHYSNGDEELYDMATDRYEWTNLAAVPEFAERLRELRALAPQIFAEKVAPKDESLPKLVWKPASKSTAPSSKPDGNPFDVVFINRSQSPVILHWMDRSGKPKLYGGIGAGKRRRQQTRPGAVWLITDSDNRPLGHFVVGDRKAQAQIPQDSKDQ